MKKYLLDTVAALSLSVFATSAHAADLMDYPTGGWFASGWGGIALAAPLNDWQLFGPAGAGGTGTSFESPGNGMMGGVTVGYRWSQWDAAASFQFIGLGNGDPSTVGFSSGTIETTNYTFDGSFGYHTMLGGNDARVGFGVRYALWYSDVNPDFPDPQGSARNVSHDFEGVGPRISLDVMTPLSDGRGIEWGAGAAVLFGDVNTSAFGGWDCTGCTNNDVTALNLDARVAMVWDVANGSRFKLGYQVQYWGDVNVHITDSTGFGGNSGTSDYLIHGPFMEFSF
jgi:hypothetical protein